MKKKAKVLFGVMAVLIMITLYTMPKMVQSSIPSIYYVTPNRTIYENVISCTGTVKPEFAGTIYTDRPVIAESVYVAVGDVVQKGDILLKIDMDRTRALNSSPVAILQQFQAGLLPARNQIDWAALASQHGFSVSVTGEAEQYKQNLEKILEDAGLLEPEPETYGAFADIDDIDLVTTPFAGIVTDVSIQASTPYSSGAALITITDNSSYRVLAQVNEADITRVGEGYPAVVRGVGFGGKSYTGRVVKVHPTARKMLNGTSTETVIDVEIRLDGSDSNLKTGLSAKIDISGGEDYDLLTVPYEVVRQDENNDEYVYVYEDGKIRKALITTGRELTNEVQVLAGLDSDSIVVYNPSDITREGMVIHLKGRANVN